MFKEVKLFSAVKSLDREGLNQGIIDMINKGMVPVGSPFKYDNEWMIIIIEYKKLKECQIN